MYKNGTHCRTVKRIRLTPNATTLATNFEHKVKREVESGTATIFKQQGNVEVPELMDTDQLLQSGHCNDKPQPGTMYCTYNYEIEETVKQDTQKNTYGNLKDL